MGYRSGNDAHVLFLRVHRRGLHCAIHLRGEPGVCDGIEVEMSELAHVLLATSRLSLIFPSMRTPHNCREGGHRRTLGGTIVKH